MPKGRVNFNRNNFKKYKNFLFTQFQNYITSRIDQNRFNTQKQDNKLIITKADSPKSWVSEIKNPEMRPLLDDLRQQLRGDFE